MQNYEKILSLDQFFSRNEIFLVIKEIYVVNA